MHWPAGITAKGELRTQFAHVIDVAPTVLEAAHLPAPTAVHGIQQAPLEGVSMLYAFDDAAAAERHTTQYFEIFVNRGIYHQGWTAVTRHSTPWLSGEKLPALDDDVWELYAPDDWTQAHDVAADEPDRLRHLQRLFLIEAAKYNVLPLDDRKFERFNSDLAGRPQLVKGNTQVLFGGMGRLSENSVINLKNKSYALTADLSVPEAGANGVIVAQGGRFGGWSLYLHEGKPAYCYNLTASSSSRSTPTPRSRPATTRCAWSSTTTAAGWPRAAPSPCTSTATPSVTGRIDATQPMIFSGDETTDVGTDSATPVSDDYTAETGRFTGRVRRVQIDIGDDANDADHLITPEERYRVAVGIQ